MPGTDYSSRYALSALLCAIVTALTVYRWTSSWRRTCRSKTAMTLGKRDTILPRRGELGLTCRQRGPHVLPRECTHCGQGFRTHRLRQLQRPDARLVIDSLGVKLGIHRRTGRGIIRPSRPKRGGGGSIRGCQAQNGCPDYRIDHSVLPTGIQEDGVRIL